jgi:oligopeptide transport system permease protein
LTAEQVEMLNEAYGLDSPVVVQYARYMGHVLQGDFGTSFRYDNQKVSDLISKKLVYTTQIGVQSLIFGVFVGIFLGALAGIRKDSIWDHFTTIVAIIGVSIPSFVMGPLLQLLFGVKLGWLPVIFITDNWLSTILPSFALSLFVISSTARFMRTELVEVLGTDYILLARAKGLKDGQVVFKHAIRNALIPVITIVGPMTITLLTGSLVIERIFGVPGVSFLMIDGIMRNDYFIILGVATFYSALYIIILIITDIMYGVIDPRIRVSGGGK